MLPVGQGVFVALVVMALVLIWMNLAASLKACLKAHADGADRSDRSIDWAGYAAVMNSRSDNGEFKALTARVGTALYGMQG